jgi:uncharacterized protein YbcV (DUF1398 family)
MSEDFAWIAAACSHGSDAGAMTFPQVLAALSQAGVERYHADLVRGEKTYYRPDGETCVVAGVSTAARPAADFNAVGVSDALRAIQARRIDYLTFCEHVAAAGCVGYHVSLAGARAVYYGRAGEIFVEPFPQSP